MPFRLLSNFGKWREGDVVSGGEISEYTGQERTPEVDQKKLGLHDGRGISADRITELVQRGILHGIGEDVVYQPDTPVILQPTFEERQAILRQYNTALGGA